MGNSVQHVLANGGFFSAVRLLISLTVDPKFSVESYDLSGAFLSTELRDRAVSQEKCVWSEDKRA